MRAAHRMCVAHRAHFCSVKMHWRGTPTPRGALGSRAAHRGDNKDSSAKRLLDGMIEFKGGFAATPQDFLGMMMYKSCNWRQF